MYKGYRISQIKLSFTFFITVLYNHWKSFSLSPEKPVEEITELEAPHFIVAIETVETTPGETVKFTCQVAGQPSPKVLWYKNDKQITTPDEHFAIEYADEGEVTLLVVDVLPEHDGKITCCAINEVGKAECSAELIVEGV